MDGLTHNDLNALGDRVTTAFRYEMALHREEARRIERGIYKRIDELKARQDVQNGRVNTHVAALAALEESLNSHTGRADRIEERQDRFAVDVAAVSERTRFVTSSLGAVSLNKKQKAALVTLITIVLGAVVESLVRHLPLFQ